MKIRVKSSIGSVSVEVEFEGSAEELKELLKEIGGFDLLETIAKKIKELLEIL